MRLAKLHSALPPDLRIVLADVGSAGGLHRRWRPVRHTVTGLLIDPLEKSALRPGDRQYPVGLADRAGRATLHVTRRVSMTSTLPPNPASLRHFQEKPSHVEVTSTLDIPTDTLDHIVAREGLDVDVLKIDVQGGEYAVLEGAKESLTRSIFFAEVETSFFERYVGLRTFDEVVAFMRGRRFDLLDIARPKRYQYRNAAGISVEGSRMKRPLGKLAFCDAYFLLDEELLLERVAGSAGRGDHHPFFKALLVMLVYDKPDVAAWLFDAIADTLGAKERDAIASHLQTLRRWHRWGNLSKRLRRRLRGIS